MNEKENQWVYTLLSWFDANHRDLPWRETKPRDPYHVWISEIMLQQTRTEAVKPYFNAWMERFPTIADVAAAEEADVLHAWQGLGYYSRARNIHKAAQVIVSEYGGQMPKTVEDIRALPGIGEYTAGAISSIAFGAKEPAIDGNLLRVFARLYAIRDDILKNPAKKEIRAIAESVIPADRPGDFNEAMMDLGADVCIPKAPRCRLCPIRQSCEAVRLGIEAELPVRTKKKPQTVFYAACGLAERNGKYLLHKRLAKGMLANMWEFPMALDEDEEKSRALLAELLHGTLSGKVWELTHIFTHRIWHMRAFPVVDFIAPEGNDWQWFTAKELREIPLAGPHARLAAALV